MDFIDQIVKEEENIQGFKIGDGAKVNFQIPKLDEGYLNPVIGRINEL